MKPFLKRVARVTRSLSKSEYGVSDHIANAVNYLLDSYFEKSIELGQTPNPDDKLLSSFVGVGEKDCFVYSGSLPRIQGDRVACALDHLIQSGTWTVCNDSFDLTNTRFQRFLNGDFSVSAGVSSTLPKLGTYLLKRDGSAPLVVNFDIACENWDCVFTLLCHKDHAKLANMFMDELKLSMAANDIYFQQCLSFEGGSLKFHSVTPTNWDQVILPDSIKSKILSNSVDVLKNADDLVDIGLCPSRNTLLISPPGMAKSTLFRAISCQLEGFATRIWCTGKSITSPYDVTCLFQTARELGPCVIFIEDMDLFGGDRDESVDSVVLNEFLSCLDGQVENSGVVILASTNDFRSMDEALINRPGRFDVKIEIPLPTKEERHQLMQTFLNRYKTVADASVTPDIWSNMLDMTDGMTGAYIHELVKSIVMSCLSDPSRQSRREFCVFNSGHLSHCVDQVLENWKLGKLAKQHH